MGTRQLIATVPSAFHDDGTLDLDAQTAVAASYVAAGCSHLIALEATGGEPETLDPDEGDRVVRAIREGAGGVPLLVGVGAAEPAAVERAHRAGAAGADGLIATVATGRQRDAELLAEVAGSGVPLWLHQRAVGAAPALDTATFVELAVEVGSDTLVVEAAPSPDAVAEVVQAGLRAFGGLAGLFLPEELEAGATGTIAASAVPEELGRWLRAVPQQGPLELEGFLSVLPYLRLEAGSPGLRVRKEAWRQRGVLHSGRTRRGRPLAATTKRAITRRLREVGVAPQDPYPGA